MDALRSKIEELSKGNTAHLMVVPEISVAVWTRSVALFGACPLVCDPPKSRWGERGNRSGVEPFLPLGSEGGCSSSKTTFPLLGCSPYFTYLYLSQGVGFSSTRRISVNRPECFPNYSTILYKCPASFLVMPPGVLTSHPKSQILAPRSRRQLLIPLRTKSFIIAIGARWVAGSTG